MAIFFFFSSRRRHTRSKRDWSSDVCSSDLLVGLLAHVRSVLVRPGWICPLAPVVRPQCLVHWHNLTVLPCRLMTFQNIASNWSKKHYVLSTIVCGPQRCQTPKNFPMNPQSRNTLSVFCLMLHPPGSGPFVVVQILFGAEHPKTCLRSQSSGRTC